MSRSGRERANAFSNDPVLSEVSAIWTSDERKARETAEILAQPPGIAVQTEPELGENDRSSTGFLPFEEFERSADMFFAAPDASHRGWERAKDAQTRIVAAVNRIIRQHGSGDLAIVSHGAVGTLLWCHLAGHPIDRHHDQPSQGHFWTADLEDLRPKSTWQTIG